MTRHWVAAAPTKARLLPDGRIAATQAVIARHLTELAEQRGRKPVSGNQVWTWCQRRRTTGCPLPLPRDVIADASTGHAAGTVDWFDLDEWEQWWESYVPARGGAPRGNSNALRHGAYARSSV